MKPAMALLTIILVIYGCRAAKWARQDIRKVSEHERNSIIMPEKIANAGQADFDNLTTFELDEESGRIKSNLVLRLDYFPAAQKGKSTLPVCFSALPRSFRIGVVGCLDAPGKRLIVTAKNVEQVCYTNPAQSRTPAASPVRIPGCRKAYVIAHQFEPQLRIDVELR